jgi:hypothetical protein
MQRKMFSQPIYGLNLFSYAADVFIMIIILGRVARTALN